MQKMVLKIPNVLSTHNQSRETQRDRFQEVCYLTLIKISAHKHLMFNPSTLLQSKYHMIHWKHECVWEKRTDFKKKSLVNVRQRIHYEEV